MKYTIAALLVAFAVLYFVKDENTGQPMIVKMITDSQNKFKEANKGVEDTKKIMADRDKQIQSYVDDSAYAEQPVDTTLSSEGYGGN
jgi:hypothetical protein